MKDVRDLPPVEERVVIINVGTELHTTLAVVSAVRHARSPVLVVNCDPTAESSEHFDRVSERWGADVVEAPLLTHGKVLDRLFAEMPDQRLLLLDSDAEILTAALPARLRGGVAQPEVFGAGFIHGGGWLAGIARTGHRISIYHERPWMPCVLFDVPPVRAALDAGVSFESATIFNDLRWSPRLSRLLGQRFGGLMRVPPHPLLQRLPVGAQDRLRSARLHRLAWARREFYGERPNYVVADTGALIYEWCRRRRGLVFDGRPLEFAHDQVRHYGGVTRKALYGDHYATGLSEVETEVRDRLQSEYGVTWNELSSMATAGVATARARRQTPSDRRICSARLPR